MAQFYSDAHRALQDRFDTRRLADTLSERVKRDALTETDRAFVTSRDFFFLSTVDHQGFPSVSYKGGDPGFVAILDGRTLAFPSYDGNGMFYSLGNIADTARVGLLFIDFEHPKRLRMHGEAKVLTDDPLIGRYPGAQLIVRVALENIFTNCPRYIHRHRRVETSDYVPRAGQEPPVPEWKRVDYLQDALPDADREKARRSGLRVTEAEYRRNFWKGRD